MRKLQEILSPTVEMKDYNARIDGKFFYDQPVKNDLGTYDNIRQIINVAKESIPLYLFDNDSEHF